MHSSSAHYPPYPNVGGVFQAFKAAELAIQAYHYLAKHLGPEVASKFWVGVLEIFDTELRLRDAIAKVREVIADETHPLHDDHSHNEGQISIYAPALDRSKPDPLDIHLLSGLSAWSKGHFLIQDARRRHPDDHLATYRESNAAFSRVCKRIEYAIADKKRVAFQKHIVDLDSWASEWITELFLNGWINSHTKTRMDALHSRYLFTFLGVPSSQTSSRGMTEACMAALAKKERLHCRSSPLYVRTTRIKAMMQAHLAIFQLRHRLQIMIHGICEIMGGLKGRDFESRIIVMVAEQFKIPRETFDDDASWEKVGEKMTEEALLAAIDTTRSEAKAMFTTVCMTTMNIFISTVAESIREDETTDAPTAHAVIAALSTFFLELSDTLTEETLMRIRESASAPADSKGLVGLFEARCRIWGISLTHDMVTRIADYISKPLEDVGLDLAAVLSGDLLAKHTPSKPPRPTTEVAAKAILSPLEPNPTPRSAGAAASGGGADPQPLCSDALVLAVDSPAKATHMSLETVSIHSASPDGSSD